MVRIQMQKGELYKALLWVQQLSLFVFNAVGWILALRVKRIQTHLIRDEQNNTVRTYYSLMKWRCNWVFLAVFLGALFIFQIPLIKKI